VRDEEHYQQLRRKQRIAMDWEQHFTSEDAENRRGDFDPFGWPGEHWLFIELQHEILEAAHRCLFGIVDEEGTSDETKIIQLQDRLGKVSDVNWPDNDNEIGEDNHS
jgi:hypothetical protein